MKIYYLIRLDDACPNQNKMNWDRIESLFLQYSIRPMVGVIPNNQSVTIGSDPENLDFWDVVKNWERMGWSIAMHGYNHCYVSKEGGINPLWDRSEFAGVPLDEQCNKIRKGYMIMKENGIIPNYFYAPSHTFDYNTLKAIKKETDIRIISDTIAFQPYIKKDFIFIPQISGSCKRMFFPGYYTFCYHPSRMKEKDFNHLELFLKKYNKSFIGFDELNLSNVGKKRCIDNLVSWIYFTYRRIKR